MNFHAHASSSAGNLYTLTDGRHRLAIDCGIPWKQMQRALDYRVSELDGVLLSHAHGDHARAVRDVLRAGVDVYASADTWLALPATNHHRARVIYANDEHSKHVEFIGAWHVRPFRLPHDAEGTLGFLVQGPSGGKCFFACDCAYLPVRWPAGTEILALECNWSPELVRETEPAQVIRVLRNHMSLPRLLDALAANDLAGVRAIWLLHLSDAHSDERAFKESVERATGKPTYVAAAHKPL